MEDPNQTAPNPPPLPSLAPPSGRALVVIGNFDGVHRGHQALLRDAAVLAASRGLRPVALTFHPHPALALGRTPPPLLTSLPRKVELIEAIEGFSVHVEAFDERFAAQSTEGFADQILVGRLDAALVLVGQDFRFGRGRSGDFSELARLGDKLGFEAQHHALVGDDQGRWSSTRIRASLGQGDLADAERMLGRPHMLSGEVVHGDARGHTIGFATCNLGQVPEALPPNGVYAVRVDRELAEAPRMIARSGERLALGVANVGTRPTVDASGVVRVEVHLFDLDQDLYGARLRVHLIDRVRDEMKFSGLDELKAQIARDAAEARAKLAARGLG